MVLNSTYMSDIRKMLSNRLSSVQYRHQNVLWWWFVGLICNMRNANLEYLQQWAAQDDMVSWWFMSAGFVGPLSQATTQADVKEQAYVNIVRKLHAMTGPVDTFAAFEAACTATEDGWVRPCGVDPLQFQNNQLRYWDNSLEYLFWKGLCGSPGVSIAEHMDPILAYVRRQCSSCVSRTGSGSRCLQICTCNNTHVTP